MFEYNFSELALGGLKPEWVSKHWNYLFFCSKKLQVNFSFQMGAIRILEHKKSSRLIVEKIIVKARCIFDFLTPSG